MRKIRFNEDGMDVDSSALLCSHKRVGQHSMEISGQRSVELNTADVKRLKALEIENGRLKKLLAERDLDIEVLKEINAKKW